MKYLLFVLACSLAACAIAPIQAPVMDTQTVTVKVEVPVPCVDSIPDAPLFLADADLLAGSGSQAADHLWIDHIQRKDYIAQLLAVLLKCEAPPTKLSAAPIK